jgi:hypothetical protein
MLAFLCPCTIAVVVVVVFKLCTAIVSRTFIPLRNHDWIISCLFFFAAATISDRPKSPWAISGLLHKDFQALKIVWCCGHAVNGVYDGGVSHKS